MLLNEILGKQNSLYQWFTWDQWFTTLIWYMKTNAFFYLILKLTVIVSLRSILGRRPYKNYSCQKKRQTFAVSKMTCEMGIFLHNVTKTYPSSYPAPFCPRQAFDNMFPTAGKWRCRFWDRNKNISDYSHSRCLQFRRNNGNTSTYLAQGKQSWHFSRKTLSCP